MDYQLKNIAIGDLELDPENPRLPNYVERDAGSMLEFLAKSSSIEELMSAISENDFFPAESLIAVPHGKRYIVVEGNRRLTALLLLAGATYDDMSPRITDIQKTAKFKPKIVPVSVFKKRSDVLNYLGNRHIAGVKAWGSLAKARYIKQLYDQTSDKLGFSDRCRSVAKVIGSRRDFIAKSMKAFRVYKLAEDNDFFGVPGLDEQAVKFSLISTAIDYEGVQDFIYGSPDEIAEGGEQPERDPSPEHVKEFFTWLFVKDKTNKTKIGESRNLNKLSKIMLNKEALSSFRKGASIDQAYLLTTGVEEDFDALCSQIQRDLREANSLVADVQTNEFREDLALSIFKQARQLEAALRS
ncbi:hypothetical protein [Rhizobium leguminosarum]|uniref:hypothetical protein n=1 Tax=Rhizobium leguminosarum TaxID=384 RepID=UPI003F9A7896